MKEEDGRVFVENTTRYAKEKMPKSKKIKTNSLKATKRLKITHESIAPPSRNWAAKKNAKEQEDKTKKTTNKNN